MMIELEQKYEELMTKILSSIAAELKKDIVNYENITSLINVPLNHFNGEYCDDGFIVDLCNTGQFDAGQSAKSGESGDLLSKISFEELLSISTDKITSTVANDFLENNKTITKFTKNLIIKDKKRHIDVKELWKSELQPPENAYISNIPISPFRLGINGSDTNPIFGISYSLTSSEHLNKTTQNKLIRTAQNVGAIALKYFVKELLDNKLQSIINRWESDEKYIALASFTLFHHWFFPHKLSAYKILLNLTGNKKEASEIYYKFGCLPPIHPKKLIPLSNLEDLVGELVCDLYALILSSYSNDKNLETIHAIFGKKTIKEEFFSVLVALTCRPKYLNGNFQLTEKNVGYEYATALPNHFKFPSSFDCVLPIYYKSQIRNKIKEFKIVENNKLKEWQIHFEELKNQIVPNWIENCPNKNIANKLLPRERICHEKSNDNIITPISTVTEDWKSCAWVHRLHSFTLISHIYNEEHES